MIDDEVSDAIEVTTTEEKEADTPPVEEENKKNKQDKPVVQVIGYVESLRKIITKK